MCGLPCLRLKVVMLVEKIRRGIDKPIAINAAKTFLRLVTCNKPRHTITHHFWNRDINEAIIGNDTGNAMKSLNSSFRKSLNLTDNQQTAKHRALVLHVNIKVACQKLSIHHRHPRMRLRRTTFDAVVQTAMMTGTTHFIIKSGRRTDVAATPTPDLAVP